MPGKIVAAGWTDQAGTIEDLLKDAHGRGFPARDTLVYEWVGLGLLDHPQRRSRGSLGGSEKAIWPWTQRNLFRLLVDKRPQLKTLAALCNVPVAIWLGWGESYISTGQVRRALRTWAVRRGKSPSRLLGSKTRHLVDFLDDLEMKASRYQRERLMDALESTARNRRIDPDLEEALEEVFDPGGSAAPSGRPSGRSP